MAARSRDSTPTPVGRTFSFRDGAQSPPFPGPLDGRAAAPRDVTSSASVDGSIKSEGVLREVSGLPRYYSSGLQAAPSAMKRDDSASSARMSLSRSLAADGHPGDSGAASPGGVSPAAALCDVVLREDSADDVPHLLVSAYDTAEPNITSPTGTAGAVAVSGGSMRGVRFAGDASDGTGARGHNEVKRMNGSGSHSSATAGAGYQIIGSGIDPKQLAQVAKMRARSLGLEQNSSGSA
jgi:hypothetical protein